MKLKLMLFSMAISSAFLAHAAVGDSFSYQYEGQYLDYVILDEDAKTVEVKKSSVSVMKGDFVIPAKVYNDDVEYTVTAIAEKAFWLSYNITSITIPNTVVTMGYYSFQGCRSLTQIKVEEGNPVYSSVDGVVYSKDMETLVCCPAGKTGKFSIPNTVSTIGRESFYTCSKLTSVNIPNSVTTIGYEAFYDCSGLTSIVIPNSVTTLSQYAFHGCEYAESVEIPESVTFIARYCFSGCKKLTEVVIPNTITHIENYAFYNDTALTTLTLGKSIEYINGSAFERCRSLETVYSYPVTPPFISTSVFEDIPDSAVLYVPKGCLADYMSADVWKDFFDIREMEGDSGVTDIAAGDNGDSKPVYFNLNGVRADEDQLAPGIYTKILKGKSSKILVK